MVQNWDAILWQGYEGIQFVGHSAMKSGMKSGTHYNDICTMTILFLKEESLDTSVPLPRRLTGVVSQCCLCIVIHM